MEALKKLAQKAFEPQGLLIEKVMKSMAGMRKARGYKTVHASDITKSDFCPRMVALLDITKKEPKGEYLDAALSATFDVGNATAKLFTDKWAVDMMVGHWMCRVCEAKKEFCRRPLDTAPDCKVVESGPSVCNWEYQEVKFTSTKHAVSGSIDAIMDSGAPKLLPVELKIIKPEDFEKLAMPLAEHRIRTNLYLRLIEDSDSPYKDKLNLQEARVIYVSRGYGKKHAELGKVIPFKEFKVGRNDGALAPYLAKASEVKLFRDKKVMPHGICPTSLHPNAKKCAVVGECFGGKHPALNLPNSNG